MVVGRRYGMVNVEAWCGECGSMVGMVNAEAVPSPYWRCIRQQDAQHVDAHYHGGKRYGSFCAIFSSRLQREGCRVEPDRHSC
ncbi:hypothetical protein CDAR_515131 [Caerostris darwini]|uniref:Uncharacterized protein n=1 Tax=Caerostris darwini TaxID=1538125 RepID=A0AAV4M8F0_9ARAC|nr:hypothetical protein CDAR_515131 [Caerostris darwini]